MTQATETTGNSSEVQLSEVVDSALQEISHIATLPEITLKIIKLVEDPDSTAQDLTKVITNDPALGARILKVVNSAFYGLPGQIGSINRAIVLLGLNAVKNIAIAASLAKLFRGGQICPEFDAKLLWNHSIASASCTSLLAEKIGLGLPDEAFLAGLIHDLGIMVEIQARRLKFVQVCETMAKNPSLTIRQAERDAMGATHEDFGAGLCRLWKFPQNFVYVTGYHHHPLDLAENNRTLAMLVHVADLVAVKAGVGFEMVVEIDEIDPLIMKESGLTEAHIAEACEELPRAVEEASAFMNA